MKDRIPLYPGRVKLAAVAGQPGVYDMVRADEATQEGTPLNSATLFSPETAAIYGLTGADATVNKALELIGNGRHKINIRVVTPLGYPLPGVSITGLTASDGSTLVTDDDGWAYGECAANISELTLTATTNKDYVDLASSASITVNPVTLITKATITIPRSSAATTKFDDVSGKLCFSPDVGEVDVSCCGGGGGGGGTAVANESRNDDGDTSGDAHCGGGGGGGYVTNTTVTLEEIPNDLVYVVGASGIGAAAKGTSGKTIYGTDGGDGGETYVTVNGEKKVSALGGKGGKAGTWVNGTAGETSGEGGEGNGSGGHGYGKYSNGSNGTAATQTMQYPTSRTVSGGGAGGTVFSTKLYGGSPYGGNNSGSSVTAGGSGRGYGGGGAAAKSNGSYSPNSGSGYKGCVGFAWRIRT